MLSASTIRRRTGFGLVLIVVGALAVTLSVLLNEASEAYVIGTFMGVAIFFLVSRARWLRAPVTTGEELDRKSAQQYQWWWLLMFVPLVFVPDEWVALVGFPAAGGLFGTAAKLLTVGRHIGSEAYPQE